MPPATARTATDVSVAIARDPALVRTVRLVAAAVARRASSDEDFVEEVRLAVGEACGVLVGTDDTRAGDSGPVLVSMRVEDRLRVVVRAAGDTAEHDPPGSDVDGIEPWSLLRGLIEDFEVDHLDGDTSLSMSWPMPSA